MKLWKNKLVAAALILIGIVSTIVMDGNATVLLLFGGAGVALLFAKKNWVY